MLSLFGAAAEALLWPWGIKKKRQKREGSNGEEEVWWEIDTVHFISAVTGATVSWYVLNKLKAESATQLMAATPSTSSSSTALPRIPRIPLSEFLQLLRKGAVTAVTYVADKPPAGALLVNAALPVAVAASKPLLANSAAAPARLPAPSGTQLVETLLLPGCHQGLFEELRGRDIVFECVEVAAEADGDLSLSLLIDCAGLLASVAALWYLFRGNGTSFTGKHLEDSASDCVDRRPPVTFADVAGMENTKEELREVISYLRDPKSFYALGARPPCGLLLAGPSGTGKTLLARAVAGEAGVTFLYASSAAFVEIYVGQGAQRIRQFFEQARSCAPCIVFLDELDAVGASRQYSSSGGNQEYAQTLNQLLIELDGVESHCGPNGHSVVTIAATNRYDCLDEALVRPGRLDRIVMVGLPNEMERKATLEIHARKLHTEGLDFAALAKRTEGSSGAELANLLNEAALLAARRRADAVRTEHVEEVLRQPRPQQSAKSSAAASAGAESFNTNQNGAADIANAVQFAEFLGRAFTAGASPSPYGGPGFRGTEPVVTPVD